MEPPPVQYVTTSDGYRIAYCVSGEGLPLICISPLFHDTRQTWQFYRGWMEGMAARFRLIQYDPRGSGMSTRTLPESVTPADFVLDLEAVVERLQVKRFLIWALGGSTHTAVHYAARHAEQVEALVLLGPVVSGQTWGSALWTVVPNENWEQFLRAIIPAWLTKEATRERIQEYQRTVKLDDWNAYMRSIMLSNVEEELRLLPMPVLVLHPRDSVMSTEESMKLAAMIPDGRFLSLSGEYFADVAVQGLESIDRLVEDLSLTQHHSALSPAGQGPLGGLSPRESEVLRLLAAGRSNQEIADELVISRNTVIRHVSNIFAKTGVTNRVEAAQYATRSGLI